MNTSGSEYVTAATGYEDGTGLPTESGMEGPPDFNEPTEQKKKGSSKALFLGLGAVGLLAAGAGAFIFMNNSNQPAPKQSQQTAQTTQEEQIQSDEPQDQLTIQDEQSAVDPLTGLPLGSNDANQSMGTSTDQTMIDPITGLPMSQQSPSMNIDPTTGLPVNPNVSQESQSFNLNQQDPMAMLNGTTDFPSTTMNDNGDQIKTQNIEDTSVNPLNSQGIPLPTDPLSAFKDMLAPIDTRVTTLEGKVSNLENSFSDLNKKVNQLSDRPVNRNAIKPDTTVRQANTQRRRSNNTNRQRVAQNRVNSSQNYIKITETNMPVTNAYHQEVSVSVEKTVTRAGRDCNVQAIVPGRVWVKNADGSFASYGEGEMMNGYSIQKIDPSRGVQAGGRWICN